MRFIVHGVDRTSGQDAKMPIDAASAAEAESIASLTMLVAEVTMDQTAAVGQVPYARPDMSRAAFDWPTGILWQARVLRGLSWAVAAIGALGLVYVLGTRLAVMVESNTISDAMGLLHLVAANDVGNAICLLVLACLMRLSAHFTLGFRELLLRKLDREN